LTVNGVSDMEEKRILDKVIIIANSKYSDPDLKDLFTPD